MPGRSGGSGSGFGAGRIKLVEDGPERRQSWGEWIGIGL